MQFSGRASFLYVNEPEPVMQRVRPHGNSSQRGDDRGIIDEKLVCHHRELFVTASSEMEETIYQRVILVLF